jgi:hypothetical protein
VTHRRWFGTCTQNIWSPRREEPGNYSAADACERNVQVFALAGSFAASSWADHLPEISHPGAPNLATIDTGRDLMACRASTS